MAKERIGLLTGGGDAPGTNKFIQEIVEHANGNRSVIGFKDGLNGLLDQKSRINLTRREVRDIGDRGGTILGTASEGPWSAKIGSGETAAIYTWVLDKASENLERWGIDKLVVLGGDGTLQSADQLAQHSGIKVFGATKTIDNDILNTDTAIGHETAIDRVAEACTFLQTHADSHHRVMLLETMGRNSGWLALAGGSIGDARMILIPEITPNIDSIIKSLDRATRSGYHSAIVAVSEGVSLAGGFQVVSERRSDAENRLGGVVRLIEREIKLYEPDRFKIRTTILGHTQRGGSPSTEDKKLAGQLAYGVIRAIDQNTPGVVVKKDGKIQLFPFYEVTGGVKKVDPESDQVLMARSRGISFGDNGSH